MEIYQQNRHKRAVGWSTWHIQWCTKYRYKIFYTDKLRNLCKIAISETVDRHNIKILDCEVDIDHVHVLVGLELTTSPVEAVRKLKSCSARIIFGEEPHVQRLYPNKHLWAPGKFVGSVGHITLEKAKKYLEEHHAKAFLPRESQL